jgi:tryptophan synthase alpha chain
MSVDRIDARFAALKADNRAAFVAYVMAGDPDAATSLRIMTGLVEAGADILELGFPFSDPMAEGPPIQRASQRALKAGMTVRGCLDVVRAFRAGDVATPLILMGYLNPLLSYGLDRFAEDAAAAGADGMIVVDCPPEEAGPLHKALKSRGMALIRLAAPTTDAARLPAVVRDTAGFVYYVSVAGVTGTKEADADAVAPAVQRLREASGLPVAVGFGIRTPARAAEVARVADAAVVGSALVEIVAEAVEANEDPVPKVVATARALAQAVRLARCAEETV